MDKTIFKTILNRRTLILLEVLALVGVGFFWGEQIRQFVLDKKDTFLPAIEWESADLMELTPPETLEEDVATEEMTVLEEVVESELPLQESTAPSVVETEVYPEQPVVLSGQEASFAEIEQQIKEASLLVESISRGVAELLEASSEEAALEEPSLATAEQETESQQLAQIATRIREISAEVEIISQELVELELVES